ncbi:MAG: ABC transporter permease, partial [Rhodospirillales bacterium]|nr:ABC transporter permease [Rhodospirillales bacterium]
MFPDWLIPALLTIITASTPLVFAAVGEIVVEKSGVLNLGVEGMMIVGAISAFAIGVSTGNATLAIIGGAVAGAGVALIFGFLTLYLLSN